jgi:hypothetical protein
MEEIDELIKKYDLQEDSEHVIIPFIAADGRRKRCFLLKRRFVRIAYGDGHHADYTLAETVEAIMHYPEMKLSEALYLMQRDDPEKSAASGRAGHETGAAVTE